MGDRPHSPLSVSCVRALNDKLYEKRKIAAQEIDKMVKEFLSQNNTTQIRKLLRVLGEDFAVSHNLNTRKGGLMGLAATAIGLGKESDKYVSGLVRPVLACFHDQDSGVRYYACEALYNIVKVCRGSVLPYFNDIFNGLSKLTADPDQHVKNGTELLDRLIKDIVTESSSFDLVAFIPLLRERIYTTNTFARQFVVSWISVLDAVPNINMLFLLPDILDGLFRILGDSNPEISKACENVFNSFLTGIRKSKNGVNFHGMGNILIVHSQSSEDLIQHIALMWLHEFVVLSGRTMLPFASGIINATLPCLAYSDTSQRQVKEAAKMLNMRMMQIVDSRDDQLPTTTTTTTTTTATTTTTTAADSSSNSSSKKESDNTATAAATTTTTASPEPGETTKEGISDLRDVQLDIASVISVLCQMLTHNSIQTRIAALQWFGHLLNKIPIKTFQYIDDFFPLFLQTLKDPSDEVVLLDLEALAEISSNPAGKQTKAGSGGEPCQPEDKCATPKVLTSLNHYFDKFMMELIHLFHKEQNLLEEKGTFILRQLALQLNAEDIYRALSEILRRETDAQFACIMVQTLNTILLTSTELFELRNQLKDLKTPESCSLFTCLYKSWCHGPVATVSLCYLTQNYQHACDLLETFGDLEITKEFLIELDKLVQLIESPIFAYLRLQMLEAENNQYLVKSMYGILMLLPQSEAFRILQARLQCIPNFHLTPVNRKKPKEDRILVEKIDFKELLNHFLSVQKKHRESRISHRYMSFML
ncbi:protein VAC14 homolog [Argonauta hians]